MNNLICVFFGHRIHPLIGKFATWWQANYAIAEFRLCSRCKQYFIYTLSKPIEKEDYE